MSDDFFLNVSTPDKVLFSGMVETLELTSALGKMGILAGHKPLLVAMETAPIRFLTADGWREAAVAGGYAQIKNDEVIILAHSAEWPEDIEVSRALEAKRRAEEKLQLQLNEREYFQTQVALQRALLRLSMTMEQKTK